MAEELATNVFARQESIPLTLPEGVALIGCGGVGAWLGYLLALAGVPKLMLFDGDNVSDTNLNRMPYGPAFLGKPKTLALAALIESIRPRCKVRMYPNFSSTFADALKLESEVNWVVATTDTWASRREAYEWTRSGAVAYVEAAAEGEYGSMAGSPAEWATAEEGEPGYASVPVWVGPAVSAAAMACAHILHSSVQLNQVARFGWDAEAERIRFTYRNE